MILACSARLDAATFEDIMVSYNQRDPKVSTQFRNANIV